MKKIISTGICILILITPLTTNAFESGSTGADGAFNPATNTLLTLPPSGIFNFTDVSIPAGVTITFAKNESNTPVTILATGNVTIDGAINLNGASGGGPNNGAPGSAGPGGFNGGSGGLRNETGLRQGGNGLGPGGGEGAPEGGDHGAGGSFGSKGREASVVNGQGESGPTYGSADLRTLIGGSGGGGGAGKSSIGPGGGGGGGAILIAASGAITVNGVITASGGAGISTGWCCANGLSGSGSGGAIRLIATTLQGEGTISAAGNSGGVSSGYGRIRLEAESMLRISNTSPGYSFSTPSPAFFSNFPALRITTIAGASVPSSPTGFRDVVLPGVTTNPVTVSFETNNIPVGTTITLTASPERGTASTAISTAVSGSDALGTATAEIDLPAGNSTLLGQATFTITVADNSDMAEFSKYAQNEKVEKLKVSVNTHGKSETTFITASGKEFTWPSNVVAMN